MFICKAKCPYLIGPHITDPERIKKLLVLLSIAFCWALKTGEWQHNTIKPIKIKKHGRLEKSLFRYGLDLIQDTLFKIENRAQQWKACLQQLVSLKDYESNPKLAGIFL